MTAAKNIFLILGILCILFNLIGYIGGHRPFIDNPNIVEQIAYFIGSNIFLIGGLIFLLISNHFRKKIRRKKDNNLVESLFKSYDDALK